MDCRQFYIILLYFALSKIIQPGLQRKGIGSTPEEAKHLNKNGITALHWLIFDNAPLETVQDV